MNTKFTKIPILRGFTEIKHFYELIKDTKAIICGGYARYCGSTNKIPVKSKDIDVYCENEEIYNNVKKILVDNKFEQRFENAVSIAYNPPTDNKFIACPEINLITPKTEFKIITEGSIESILSNFDFTVTRAAILNENEILVDVDFIKHEEMKLLVIKNIHCPISSTLRFCKYSRKGYWTRPFQILKLFLDWDERGDDYKGEIGELLSQFEINKEKIDNKTLSDDDIEKEQDEIRRKLYEIMLID